jgi:hypothetical protein
MKKTMNITYPAFALFAFACFALSPTAQALLPPPAPDGGYPGFNTAEGDGAMFSLTSGLNNTAVGFLALNNDMTGGNNTAIGANALLHSVGSGNTATGAQALSSNTNSSNNTADGFGALQNNTGQDNTATGALALSSNITGSGNTANGLLALSTNNSGFNNTAIGNRALQNTTAGNNTATGSGALLNNGAGHDNTATGLNALFLNQTGIQNTADGDQALFQTTGGNNIALGFQAGMNLTFGSNNIDIGALGSAGESNTIRIGKSGIQTKTFIQGIRGVTVANGVGVIVGTTGQLGTVVSSARFKEAIKPMDKASEAILALKPVTFRYKKELDPDKIPQFGLIAEEVEKVNPELVARDEEGNIMSVRYEAVNAMLLNEFLKEHRTVQDLKAIVVHQQKQIETLTTGLVKVSAELELSKPAPQTVLNNR